MPEQVKPTQRPRSKSSLNDKETHITFWKLFKNELRKNLDSKPERTTPDLKYIQSLEHLTNLYTVPFYLEQFMSFGLVYCLNSFLTLLTIIPLRVLMVSILKLRAAFTNSVPGRYRFKREDVTWILLLLSSSIAISSIDTSKIYHNIKAGTVIKLYVMVSVLEVADKLLSSLGQDILRVSFNFPLERSLSCAGKCFLVALLSTTYISVHACVFVYQIMSLNVAVNSYSNALLTLLLSVQFAEIKSAVFKRLEREGLFQMACADLYERFQLFLMLFIISVRNLVQLLMSTEFSIRSRSLGENIAISPVVISWIGMLMGPSFAVIGSELLVDWLKHLYIGKFNRIKPQIYRRYTRILSQDFLREYRQNDPDCTNPPATTESFATMNIRLGLPLLPITVAFCKMVISSVRKACSTQNFDQSVLLAVASAAVILILLRMSTYVMLIRWARHNTRAKTSPSSGDYLKGSPNTSLAGIEDIHTRSLLYGSDEKIPQSKEEQRSHNANRDGDKSLAQVSRFEMHDKRIW
ncbi:hypothetical protein LJB42_003161 [Komagataella kurtzmanii]|nr:hypothetical protein LJB42_003161 [Komagataella kurtzmanii]